MTPSTTTEEENLAYIQEARNREAQDQAAQARTVKARKKPRPKFINPGEAALLIFAAVICDLVSLLSAIPVLGSVIGGVIWLGWFIWLKLKQAKGAPRTWSRLLIGGGIIEIIPFLGVLPTWIAFVLVIILLDASGKVPILGKAINMGKV